MTLRRSLSTITIGLIALICWLVLPAELEMARKIPAFFAAVSMLCMALALWLATRPRLAEPLFGGIDRAYKWHKYLGIFGLLGASLHWLLVPGPAGGDVVPMVAESGEEMGEVAMYLLLVLGLGSMLKRLPYNLWYYSHKLMGPVFLISVYHTFFSDVPFETLSLTGFVLMAISALGILSWLYKTFFFKHRITAYKVSGLHTLDDAIEVRLSPAGKRKINYKAGQFAYLNFKLEGRNEFHPFTIASCGQRTLRFYIKALGDHTQALQDSLQHGQLVEVDGPYGRLHAQRDKKQAQIWLAGGVGITPFLAWLAALKRRSRFSKKPEIHIFFSAQGTYFGQMCRRLSALIKPKQKVFLHAIDTSHEDSARLNGEQIVSKLSQPIEHYQVFACGPNPMLKALKQQLGAQGMHPSQWHNERFDMR